MTSWPRIAAYTNLPLGCIRISDPSGGGDDDGQGGDGLTFVIHNDARGVTVLGSGGGGLGLSTISPSLAIEFDTWEGPESLIESVKESIAQFELEHHRVASLLNRIMASLGDIGI